MKFHIHVPRAPRGRWDARRCASMLATVFACAALFLASQSASRAAAQSRFDRGVADHSTKPAQDAVSATPQMSAAVATPADTDVLTSVLGTSVPEAPVPETRVPETRVPGATVSSLEEARLVSPTADMFLSLAQGGGQSSSSQSLPSGQNLPPENSSSTAPPAQARAVKTKSPHHGLGVALAIVGSAALAVGVAAYALGDIDICANDKSGGCKEVRDAGLVLMPVGGGVAVTGFYLVFHH
jgi:hypothetical protein